jgi:hypothetical protein
LLFLFVCWFVFVVLLLLLFLFLFVCLFFVFCVFDVFSCFCFFVFSLLSCFFYFVYFCVCFYLFLLLHYFTVYMTFYIVTLFISLITLLYSVYDVLYCNLVYFFTNTINVLIKSKVTHYKYLFIVTKTRHPKWQVILIQNVQYLVINCRIIGNKRNKLVQKHVNLRIYSLSYRLVRRWQYANCLVWLGDDSWLIVLSYNLVGR